MQADDFQTALFHAVDDLPPAVRTWMAADPAAGVYGHPDWYANLWTAAMQTGGGTVAIHVVLRQGAPVLVLPLWVEANGRTARSLANFYSPLALPNMAETVDSGAWHTLIAAVRRAHPRATTVHLGPLPQALTDRHGAVAVALRSHGYKALPYLCFGNWFMRPGSSWETYWAQRPPALRNTIARKRRKFERLGGHLRLYCGQDSVRDLEAGIAAFQQVYAESWKGPEPHPAFMPSLMRLAAQLGWLRLGVAWLDKQPVAAQVWLHAHGKTDIYKLAYREQYREWGAGSLLTAALMMQALTEDRAVEVDYLMGDDPYKADWVDQRRERWSMAAYAGWQVQGRWAWFKHQAGVWWRHVRKTLAA